MLQSENSNSQSKKIESLIILRENMRLYAFATLNLSIVNWTFHTTAQGSQNTGWNNCHSGKSRATEMKWQKNQNFLSKTQFVPETAVLKKMLKVILGLLLLTSIASTAPATARDPKQFLLPVPLVYEVPLVQVVQPQSQVRVSVTSWGSYVTWSARLGQTRTEWSYWKCAIESSCPRKKPEVEIG